MLIYSVIYFLLAIYIERINPGEFGVAQPWNYLFKRSYWKPHATSKVQPLNMNGKSATKNGRVHGPNDWIELNRMTPTENPSVTISHLTKVNDYMFPFSVLATCIYLEIWKI
jgi:ATP-binding cassette subfamily A (ABC1) protein 3